MKKLLGAIDSVSHYTGAFMRWFIVALILILTFEVTGRYVFNHPTQWAHQTSLMMSGAIVALGWAYVHRHNAHVRVDILYSHLTPRGRAIIDIVMDVIIFFPLIAALVYTAWNKMWYSWEMNEIMTETYWYPPVGPNRTAIFLGIALLGVQGVSNFIKSIYHLSGKSYD